ncbi:hypothetical protein CLIM01_09719 [Colletotrichum limetticola]|uniref:Uncharacterized protein n=1 Tax=Colletotrichum limetticola TaxID=1209924 RepID=A0ABQ9PN40_9PEZI|nr:hypothetical protein CLIM01_09719 [Colletotrichum limetticola]
MEGQRGCAVGATGTTAAHLESAARVPPLSSRLTAHNQQFWWGPQRPPV